MARAKRHYIPGYVWHITHRCHKREFLLKFQEDRSAWLKWLFQAKKRYGLKVLNYTPVGKELCVLIILHIFRIIRNGYEQNSLFLSLPITGLTGYG